jgi:predicted XRE-type DNA-binding protein
VALTQEIRGRGLTQTKAAEILGVTQPDISNLMRGNVDGFSQERLERLLNALDLDVRIQVGPKPAGQRAAGVRVERVSSFIS